MVFEQLKERAANAAPIGGTLKFVVDELAIYIDGTGDTNTATLEDKEADCTITVSQSVLEQLRDGKLNPMMAVMGGQIKIAGDMGLAMKVQSLMG
jgi:putative sterol carrier protein